MESPGEYLKRERELRGITLDKVHEVTRIQAKYLEALEADDYARLPAPAFVKGFIRAYCKHLGVDEDDAVLRYEVFLREQEGGEEEEPRVEEPTPEEITAGPHKANTRNIILLVAAGVVIIILIYVFSSMKGGEGPERVVEEDAVEAPAPEAAGEEVAEEAVDEAADEAADAGEAAPVPEAAPAPKPEPEPVTKPAPTPVPRPKPAPAPAIAPAPPVEEKEPEGRYALTLEAKETVWVEVAIDNDEPFDVILRAGEGVTWRADREFALVVGNAGGVTMTFDGKEYGPLGESGEVIRLELPWKGTP